MHRHFQMFAAYNRWANARLYAAATELTAEELNRDTGAVFGPLIGTLNHLLVTDRIWMRRFTGQGEAPAALDAILHPDLPGLRAAREAEDARIIGWVEGLTEAALSAPFTYTTIADRTTITQRLTPALAHFFNHQTHHRGQAHATLTALGRPSLVLDLLYFQRAEEGRAFA